MNIDYIIREIKKEEYPVLEYFLYEAIFLPEGVEPLPKDVIKQPDLQIYVSGFGREKDDNGLVAVVGDKIVGAVWTRIIDDYGHVDDETPSFSISLYKEYRGLGIGTDLMKEMLLLLKKKGYKKASLSVQKANYAVKMYQDVGFEIIEERQEDYIMVCDLSSNVIPMVRTKK